MNKTTIGLLTEAEIKQLSRDHDVAYETIQAVMVEVSDTETSIGYYKKPNRLTIAKALTHFAKNELLESGSLLVANTWIGGDARQKSLHQNDEAINIAAAITLNGAVDFLASRLKSSSELPTSAESLEQTSSGK